MLWKKLIERKVNTDSLWRGLAERREWIQFLFKPKPGESHRDHSFYRMLYPSIIKDIEVINVLWQPIWDGNPAKKSADSDSGFYCIFFALRNRIRIPILPT